MVASLLLECVVRKVAIVKDRLCIVDVKKQYHHEDVFSGWVDLALTSSSVDLRCLLYLSYHEN